MTRKDYQLIAGAMNREYTDSRRSEAEKAAILATAYTLASSLSWDNQAFDTNRFITAVRTGVSK